ncbi:MAG: NAD-dependent succinate-semialdehyde dehydrogenase [Bacteroidota bacterium]|nr:NAD-dependent succinate-semialdehyde dehydrogenase [Candidatus Kapabacteria bacterium]MCX7936985.1 NAD-dependent succinate-semialdehyde dehydrogenase [Chlorobiota bacterium]MDW8075626.1 NAD-dependent succinate-semialdehyde dehydrogenase [Bacteroidota bacterium]MDW8272129.1 NAD-dependent succinate-semialdehyde dehydrogenase [Bacteroidota bacterium]
MDFISRNPATGEVIARYGLMSDEELDAALDRAWHAARRWRATSLEERRAAVLRVAEILQMHREEAARLAALEMGKPIVQGRAELDKCAWACRSLADQAEAALAPVDVPTEFRRSRVVFEPLGVVLAIMPWNFPFWQVIRAAIPAMLAGNAVLVKHSPEVTGCALLLDRMMAEAGLAEVYTTIRASHQQIAALIGDARIAGVTLTGSTRAGRHVAARAGEALKKTVLELGGSDPYLVLDDADLAYAAETCAATRMINSGQSCIAAKRFIVLESVRSAFEEMLVEHMRRYQPADPLAEETMLGPLARPDLAETLAAQAAKSIEEGARVLLAGGPTGSGAYVRPIVLTDVQPGMPAFDEETFGPLAVVVPARTEEEAILLANRSTYGLGAAVFTQDLDRAERIAAQLEAGSVFINAFVRSDPRLPFGGIKSSGWGRELSVFGLREFVNIKTVVVA